MLSVDNETQEDFDISLLEKIADELTQKEVELLFVNSEKMKELNKQFMQKDETTDVLSFPLDDLPFVPLGNIVINVDLAKSVSLELKHDFIDEVALLFIHGMLHLLGYDHEKDSGQMREKEIQLILSYSLPKSLICRN